MLILSNDDVAQVIEIGAVMDALERAYLDLAAGRAVCRPRIDVAIPTSDPGRIYRWGSMEGGAVGGYFAIRMKSDIIHYSEAPGGGRTQEKYCGEPGLYCGLILLTDTESGRPLAFLQDGVLQHMRVGADGGIGTRRMARQDASVLGMLGSGGMAETHVAAIAAARPIRRLQVYSPTPAHRTAFARRMADRHGIEAVACDRPEDIYIGAHIVAACTDAAQPVLDGTRLEPGTHVINIGAGGLPDAATLARVDVYLRFGDAPAAVGHDAWDDEYLTWAVPGMASTRRDKRAHGIALPGRRVTLAELAEGRAGGRTDPGQITWSERGNLQGAQFHAVAGSVFEAARAAGLGRELPDDWFLQTIRN